MARNWHRDSLEIFGQTSLLQQPARAPGTQMNVPLFSKVPGSAWDDALKAAEQLLQGKSLSSGRPSNASTAERVSARNLASENTTRVEKNSFEDLISKLEAAEKDPTSAKQWEGVLKDSPTMEGHGRGGKRSSDGFERSSCDGYERGSRRSLEARSEVSAVSEYFVKERADQWGYRVPLKSTSRDSSPRTSGGSLTAAGSQAGTAAIPAVSRDVKDALSSFMLAFLVCDATLDDFPILYASAGFTTMTGYSGDEIIGKNCRFLQGAGTDRAEIAKLREALKNGQIYTGTVLNYRKDGTPFWNLLTLSPIKDDDETVIKYIGMQAEQNSKEKQPRNSKGQKSPIVKPQVPFYLVQDAEKWKRTAEEAVSSQSRHSANSIPRPPVAPQRTSPASSAERRSSGPELHPGEDQSRRMSQRYSLSSAPVRSSRHCSVDEFHQPVTRREAALKLRDVDGAKTSSFDVSRETSAKMDSPDGEKSKSSRLTSRILRLFRKDSKESKRQSGEAVLGKQVIDFPGSDEEDDFSQNLGRTSEISRHSACGYSTTGSSASQLRLESSLDDLSERLRRININVVGQQDYSSSSSSRSAFDGTKQQFCIVEPPCPVFYDKEEFSIVESPVSYTKQQFCIVKSSSLAPFDGPEPPFRFIDNRGEKQQSSSTPSFDGSTKQQFCIVHM